VTRASRISETAPNRPEQVSKPLKRDIKLLALRFSRTEVHGDARAVHGPEWESRGQRVHSLTSWNCGNEVYPRDPATAPKTTESTLP